MPKCNLTEEQIIAGLKDFGNQSRKSRTERCLYLDEGINKSIKGYVQNNGGNWEQANMVFDYAFEKFTSRVRLGTYPDSTRPDNDWEKTMMGIAKKAWYHRRYDQISSLDVEEWKEGFDPFSPICDADADLPYDSILEKIGSPDSDCRFIFERLAEGCKQEEIADLLSIKQAKSVSYASLRQMLVKCRKEIREKW